MAIEVFGELFKVLQGVPPAHQHTSAYVSMRQHTSAYVCTRQHTPFELLRASLVFQTIVEHTTQRRTINASKET
jgi:hypothetical protein